MEKREVLLKKIEAQEKEWEAQIKHLQSKYADFDAETRMKLGKQLDEVNKKLHDVKYQTDKFKKTSNDEWQRLGDKITHTWNDIVTNIDNAILRLKK